MRGIKLTSLLFLLASALAFSAGCHMDMLNCIKVKGAKVTTETRNPKKFTGIILEIPAEVYVQLGDESSVTITAKRRVQDQILTTIEEDYLVLEYDTCIINPDSITIFITTAALDFVRVLGSGGVSSKQTIKADEIELKVDGSGDINLALKAGTVNTKINGSGDIHLEGRAQSLVASVNGAGDVRAAKLEANSANIKINGSGDVKVYALDDLNVKINGSGDVRYDGDPEITKSVNGTGSIKRK